MSVLIGVGVGAVVLSAYVGRKGWLAFHRAVGITPGKVTYLPSKSQVNMPKLIALQVDTDTLNYLPDDIISTLKRIDDKADTYRQWQQTKQQANQETPYLEDEFVTAKLLNEHLPHIISIYVNYLQVRANPTGRANVNSEALYERIQYSQENEMEAYRTLVTLLDDIESRLDSLLLYCEKDRLNELKVMKRYLDKR